MKNLHSKLIISFAFILIIPSICIGLLAYSSAETAVEKEMMDSSDGKLVLLNSTINNTIKPKINDINYFSENITSNMYNGTRSPKLRQKFAQYAILHPEATSIFVGTEKDGLFIQEPAVSMDPDYDPRERPWYQDAMKNKGEVLISPPYQAAGTNDMVVTVSKAISDGSGVIAVSVNLKYLQKLANEVKIGHEGYALLLDKQKTYIVHPTIKPGTKAEQVFADKLYEKKTGQFEYQFNGKEKKMNFMTNEATGWKIGGTMYMSEISDSASPIFNRTLLVIVVAIILGALVVFFIIKSIIKPIKILKDKAITVSRGDLRERIDVQTTDEIGQLGQAFNDMQESLRTLIKQVEFSAEQVASSSEQLTANSEQTSVATELVAESIQEVAGSAERQTSGIDRNAQALTEISIGVSKIAESSASVLELSQYTSIQAEEGGKAVANTRDQMNSIHESVVESDNMIQSLNERSQQIGSILDVITEIANQTNLLALNAAIEAARAGEQGKGFAVVAEEVRKLAEQSQHSAQQIFELIQGIQSDTESSVHIMKRVSDQVQDGVKVSDDAIEKFDQILQSVKKITPQMEEVSATAQQMSAGVQEVTATANEMAGIAKGNAETSEEVAASTEEQLASMEEISASAKMLSSMAEELKELITKFKY
ncbi:methyl-accepting chemotaxis protein [Peribacillus asahii]|uniref:methyl-accepting chemotaxis protein n=1 Tax=Peribacillus asahii TaxID=228899 RepID=UPI00207A167A|nr:methyl-accepting chemotaxis protein [Peribacillus asahii]USK58138.1 methyl-accepting chemotaxis protein [Peribacillus asahii]